MKVSKIFLKEIVNTINSIADDLAKEGQDVTKLKVLLSKLEVVVEKADKKLSTEERVGKIIELLSYHEEGLNTKQLSQELGVSAITVGRDLEEVTEVLDNNKKLGCEHAGHNLKLWFIEEVKSE